MENCPEKEAVSKATDKTEDDCNVSDEEVKPQASDVMVNKGVSVKAGRL